MKLWPFGMRPAPVVTTATTRDAAALSAVHADGFERGWDASEFERLLADYAVICHAARPGGSGEPVGFLMSRLAADEAEILSVAVSRRWRARGIAAAMMRHHLGALATRRVVTLFLEVAEDNDAALQLYRRFGFAEVGRRSGYYRRQDLPPGTALIMRRPLA